MAGNFVIRDKVLRYIEEHVGESVYVDDAAKDLNVRPLSVQNAMKALCETQPIEVVVRGRTWRYHANANPTIIPRQRKPEKPEPRKPLAFEEIGVDSNGRMIIRDENLQLYWAERI
jgi:hypothetical protein